MGIEGPKGVPRRVTRIPILVAGVLFVAFLGAGFLLYSRSLLNREQNLIKQVVKESQLVESLELYAQPERFVESRMDQHWTNDSGADPNYDRRRIREAVNKLVAEGRRYGPETRCEQFDFQSIEISSTREFALVKTLEKWFVAEYDRDGKLLKNKTIGPYFVSYAVRKDVGKWRIEKSTTARMNRPVPTLTELTLESQPAARKEFRVALSGTFFEAENVMLEVVGPGCPVTRPCQIDNMILREFAVISDTQIKGVPLTLASGTFQVRARNEASPTSNGLELTVP